MFRGEENVQTLLVNTWESIQETWRTDLLAIAEVKVFKTIIGDVKYDAMLNEMLNKLKLLCVS